MCIRDSARSARPVLRSSLAMDAPVVSIVAPAYNEARNLAAFVQALTPVLDSLGEPWEIVFVDDGSRDNTLGLLLAARATDPRIKVVGLARNFGKDLSLIHI